LLAALNIKVIDSSANNPSSRGKAERTVQQVKLIMKKILALASSKTLNWEYIPLFVSKAMNQTVTPRTGFAPIQMVMGKSKHTESFLDLDPLFPTHHSIKGHKEEIEKINLEITEMCKVAQQNIYDLREEIHKTVNKNRIDKKLKFKTGDIVFALDRYNLPGNSRPLKTTYVVIESYYTTTLIERLADKFRTLLSNDDIKLYNRKLPEYTKTLPREVMKILVNSYENLLPEEILKIAEFDTLQIPPGIPLITEDEPKTKSFDSPLFVKGRALSGPDDENNFRPTENFHTDDIADDNDDNQDYDDLIVSHDEDNQINQNDNVANPNENNVQQEDNQDEENHEERRDLQLRGRKVTFDLP
jgi:hypothetical protein